MRFLDTNVIVRHLTGDDEEKAEACYQLLQRASRGEEILLTCEAIVAEVVYVLRSPRVGYHLTPDEIRARLVPILSLRGIRLPQKHVYINALNIFASAPTLDFEDALAIAHMQQQGVDDIFSYDRDFDSIAGIRRLEPPPADNGRIFKK